MATNKLIPYWIELREFQEPGKVWDQTNIHAHDSEFPFNNLADYFENFLRDYEGEKDVYIDEKREKTFTVQGPIKRSNNTIEGRFKSGEWGQNADFWDVEEHERIEDARKENHAAEVPYYFLFHIPDEDSSQALLILSRYKRKGVKSLFKQLFLPRNREVGSDRAYMEIKPHYSDKVLEELDNADAVASVKFRGKEMLPARERYADHNSLDRVDQEVSGVIDVGAEMRLTPKGNQDAFREMVRGLLPEEENPNFEYGRLEVEKYESASVTVIEGESQLTFPLWDDEIQMRMDVDPEEYDLDVYGGYPTPHSIGCVARQLANDLMGEFNTKLSDESLIPRSIGIPEDKKKQPATAED